MLSQTAAVHHQPPGEPASHDNTATFFDSFFLDIFLEKCFGLFAHLTGIPQTLAPPKNFSL